MLAHERAGKILSVDGNDYPEFNAYYEIGITIKVNGQNIEITQKNKLKYPIKINNYEDIQYKGEEFISFDGLDLKNIDLSKCNLSGITIRNAKLNSASFKNAILASTYFSKSDLSDADFSDSNLSNADFTSAILDNVKFDNAFYNDETLGLSDEQESKMEKITE